MPLTNTRKRRRLFKEDPHCHWCRALTLDDVEPSHPLRATLDHLDHRYHAKGELHGKVKRVVLACRKCNLERGRVDEERRRGDGLTQSLGEKLSFIKPSAP